MARSESSPSFLALCNKCFFWSVITGMITGKKPIQRRMKASKVMTVTKKSYNHTIIPVLHSAFGVRQITPAEENAYFGAKTLPLCMIIAAWLPSLLSPRCRWHASDP